MNLRTNDPMNPVPNSVAARPAGGRPVVPALLCALGFSGMLVAGALAEPARMSAAQIMQKHIAARGGLAAWHGIKSMAWSGKMEVGSGDSPARSTQFVAANLSPKSKSQARAVSTEEAQAAGAAPAKQVELPFVLELKRPTLARLEIEFAGKTAVQVYDGKAGWKVRPYLNRNEVEPFTAEELKASAGKWDMDGPLLDAAAKGTKVDLEGTEPVEGHDAYRLKLTLKNGDVQHIWIDAQSFLDVKIEGAPREMDGRMHKVYVTQRDFRAVNGVKMPYLLETSVEGYPDTHKMTIDKVSLNPVLDDKLFVKPKLGA